MLDSLAEMINHQTFKGSFEWVIVNDGSTDNQDLEELGFNHTKREAPGMVDDLHMTLQTY